MSLGLFTYITGVATLLALFLQLWDILPQYRETRKTVLLITLGVFAGTVLGTLQKVNISFGAVNLFSIVAAALILIMFISLVAAIAVKDREKRGELYVVFGWIAFAVLLTMPLDIWHTRATKEPNPEVQSKTLSTDELIVLVDTNAGKMNYERAIFWLKEFQEKVGGNDSRYKIIKQRISDLKTKQIIKPKKE